MNLKKVMTCKTSTPMQSKTGNFAGSTIALLCENKILIYLRDNKEDLNFRNRWDLPGGGRENDETPFECIVRETKEEFGIDLNQKSIEFEKVYESVTQPGLKSYFFVGRISQKDIDNIQFGDEGQKWQLADLKSFFEMPNAVPHKQKMLKEILAFRT